MKDERNVFLQENQNFMKISQKHLYSQSKNFGPSPTLKLEPMGLISLESSTQGTSNLKKLDIALKLMDFHFFGIFFRPKTNGKNTKPRHDDSFKKPQPNQHW